MTKLLIRRAALGSAQCTGPSGSALGPHILQLLESCGIIVSGDCVIRLRPAAPSFVFFRTKAGDGEAKAGPYTVDRCLDDYIADYKRRGGKALDRLETSAYA